MAATTSDRERYFILASYYERFAEDYEKAIQSYEVLVRLYPDHYWAVNNLALTLDVVGRTREAVPYFVAKADLRPNDYGSAFDAWQILRRFNGDPAVHERWLARVRRLAAAPDARAKFPMKWMTLHFSPVDELIRRGELVRALDETNRLAGTLEAQTAAERTELIASLGVLYVELGRFHEAEKYFQQLPEGLPYRYLALADLADLRGDGKAMRHYLQRLMAAHGNMGPATAARLARSGLISDSEGLASSLVSDRSPCSVQFAKGELALALGETLEAVPLLQNSFESCWESRGSNFFLVSRALARALVRQGNVSAAIEVLKRATSADAHLKPDRLQAHLKYQLLQIYRTQGREDDARRTETEIRALLAVADSDHPVLLAINREAPRQTVRASK